MRALDILPTRPARSASRCARRCSPGAFASASSSRASSRPSWTHIRCGIREAVAKQTAGVEKLLPEDIADAVAYMVARDRRIAVNEMPVRAGAHTW